MSSKLFTALTINLMNLPRFFAISQQDIQAINQFATMLRQGQIRVLSRLGITQPNLVYTGSSVDKKTKYNLENELKKLGFSIKNSAMPVLFVVNFLRSRGVTVDQQVVAQAIARMGYDVNREMRIITILRSVIGLSLMVTTTKTKGKRSQSKTTYGTINVIDVDRAVFNWVKANLVVGQIQSQNVGATFYGVPTNVREIDQVFGTIAPIAVDTILIGDTWFVTGVNYDVKIEEKTPFVTNMVIHDVNTTFVNVITSFFSSLKLPAAQFGITEAEHTLQHVFTTGGLTALYKTWLGVITEMNRSDNTKIAAAHEQVVSIKDTTLETDKVLGEIGAKVYDEVNENTLIGAGIGQQTSYGQTLFGSTQQGFGQGSGYTPQMGFGNNYAG